MDSLKTSSAINNSYQDPRQQFSLVVLIYIIPVLIQGALLHPKFSNWRILRWVRLAMTPLCVYLALKVPLDYCFLPSNRTGGLNFVLCVVGTQFALKAMQFGLTSGYMQGKFWIRKEVALTELDRSYTIESNYKRDYSWIEVIRWTIKQTASPRGMQYGWGQKLEFNKRTLRDVLKRFFKVHLLSLISTAGCVLSRDYGSPTNVLLAIGFPNHFGTKILAEGLYSLSFPAYLLSWFDLGFCYCTLLAYFISWINEKQKLNLPEWIMEWFDTRLYPVVFQSPHTATSLNELWSKGWHQFLRGDLVFLAARPSVNLAKKLGLSKTGQQISSLWAVFFVSGVLHELYILSALKAKTPLDGYFSTVLFPGALFYFMMQAIGIMIEPKIIPKIPKIIGGGTLWVWFFSLSMIIPYRKVLLGPFGVIDDALPPLSKWPIFAFFVPGTLFRAIEAIERIADFLKMPTISDVLFK